MKKHPFEGMALTRKKKTEEYVWEDDGLSVVLTLSAGDTEIAIIKGETITLNRDQFYKLITFLEEVEDTFESDD